MARQFTRGRGRLGSPRLTSWIGLPATSVTLAAASTATLMLSLNAAALATRPWTVIRTHMFWQVRSDQTGASEDYGASLGLAVVSDQALAIGVTAIPTPETDRGSDLFFVHSSLYSRFEFVSGVGFHPASGIREKVDSKAMRKVNDDQDLVIVVETPANVASASINLAGRMLIKES